MATLTPDFWKDNCWIVDGTNPARGPMLDKVPDLLDASDGSLWWSYGHIIGPEDWKNLDNTTWGGGVVFSYEDGILFDDSGSRRWTNMPALEVGFLQFLEEKGSGFYEDMGTSSSAVQAAAQGDMREVLKLWAAARADGGSIGFDASNWTQDTDNAVSFLNDTNFWEGRNISRDARLAAALYNYYARLLEYEFLYALAPSKASLERATAADTALTPKPAGITNEEKVWIYQYVHGPISINNGVLQPIPEDKDSEYNDDGEIIPTGHHIQKTFVAREIALAVMTQYKAEDASDLSRIRDQARKDLAHDQTNYEERVFNDQCFLLTNLQNVHIKSKRGFDPAAKGRWGSSMGGPGPGSLAGQGQLFDDQGRPITRVPDEVAQADFPSKWRAGFTAPTGPGAPNLHDLGWPYRNFTVLRGNPHKVSNTLLAKEGVEELLDITPTELACLMPKIEFSKVFLGGSRGQNTLPESLKEVKFPFRTTSDITNSLLEKQKTGAGVGIESVSYSLQGSNFATAKRLIDVKARFYFRSMKDFTEKINVPVVVGNQTHKCSLSFMDLVAYARGLGPDPAKQLKAGDPSNFLLKLVLGWAVPKSPGIKKIIPDSNRRNQINKALKKSTMVLFINCNSFQYSFNEDGSMTADVTYGGYLENALDSLNLDIFELDTTHTAYWDEESRFWDAAVNYFELVKAQADGETPNLETAQSAGEIESDLLSRVSNKYEISRTRLLNTVRVISQEAKVKDISWAKMINPGDDSYEAELDITSKSAEDSLREAQEKKDASSREGRGVRWRRLLEKILDKKETDIFTALVRQKALTPYQEKLARGQALNPSLRGELANRRPLDVSEFFIETEAGFGNNGWAPNARKRAVKDVLNAVSTKSTNNRKKHRNPTLLPNRDPYTRYGHTNGRDKGMYSIYFIYLGDIIEAAMEVLKDTKQQDKIYPKAKLLIGDFLPSKKIYGGGHVNLADIPISMDNFLNFYVEQVVEKERDTYPLMTFIQDILEHLVKPLLANACDSKVSSELDINTTYLMLKGGGENGERNRIPNGRINNEVLRNIVDKGGNTTPGWKEIDGYFHYLYLYADAPLSAGFRENKQQDLERKIYHLAIGRDRGIVKNASFKKRDVRGLEEARAFSERGASVNENILIPYHDVDVTLVGNTIFWPGMLFYLDPAFAGLGNRQNRRKIAHELNIGGYYRVIKVDGTISRDGFESKIDGTYVFNPLQRERRNVNYDREEARALGHEDEEEG